MIRRAIVVVGLIRDPKIFGRFLEKRATLPDSAGRDLPLIVSTWHGELENYPDIQAALREVSARIYVQQQPDLLMPGHIIHQIAALDLGLRDLDDDVFVLKTRPDLCDPADIDLLLEREPQPLPAGAPMPTRFRHRLWCKGGFAAQPFYLNDITCMGTAADLRIVPSMPFLMPFRYTNMGPEQLYWGSPFIDRIPPLDHFFRANHGLIFNNADKTAALQQCLMDSPLYARALACHALVVRDNFYMLNNAPPLPQEAGQLRGRTLEDILWHTTPITGVMPNIATGTNTVRSQAVWDALAAGDFAASPFGDRVKAFLTRYDQPASLILTDQDRQALAAETAALVESIRTRVDASPYKNPQWDGTRWLVPARTTNWRIAQTGTDLTASLEREINGLRRRVGELQAELARKSGINA